jgi:hypothetical protein
VQLNQRTLDEKIQRVAHHARRERVRIEAFLIKKIGAIAIAVEVGRLDELEVRLLEPFAGFEGLVEDGARQQVAHLQADEGLAAARRGRGNSASMQ